MNTTLLFSSYGFKGGARGKSSCYAQLLWFKGVGVGGGNYCNYYEPAAKGPRLLQGTCTTVVDVIVGGNCRTLLTTHGTECVGYVCD
jgi:hypothetical protein